MNHCCTRKYDQYVSSARVIVVRIGTGSVAFSNNFFPWVQLSTGKMDEKCSICKNYNEVCPTCKKYGQLKGCVEDKKSGWHDNGGYVPDPDEKKQNTGSWLKWKNEKK